MDIEKLIEHRERMCITVKECEYCPLKTYNCKHICITKDGNREIINIIEDWIKENTSTRQKKFLKAMPNAKFINGVINLCPKWVDTEYHHGCSGECDSCKEKYWLEEI